MIEESNKQTENFTWASYNVKDEHISWSDHSSYVAAA